MTPALQEALATFLNAIGGAVVGYVALLWLRAFLGGGDIDVNVHVSGELELKQPEED